MMAKKAKQSWSPGECLALSRLLSEGIDKLPEIRHHFPNRSIRAIRTRLYQTKKLSNTTNHPKVRAWTPEEDDKLRAFITQGKKAKEVENEFPGRTPLSVQRQFYVFEDDLERLRTRSAVRKRHEWTAEEIEHIRLALEKNMTALEIRHLLPGRTFLAIKNYLREFRYFTAPDTAQQKEQYEGSRTQGHSLGVVADDKMLIKKQMADRSMASALHSRRNRPWTPEEDKLLADLVTEHQKDLTLLWNKMKVAYVTGRFDNMSLIRTGTAARRRWLQLQDKSKYRTGSLDAEEIQRLKQAIQEQVGDKFQIMVDVHQGDHAIAAKARTETNTTGQDTRPGLKLGGPELAHLNWSKIAQQVGTRNGRQCRSYLYYNLHNGRRGSWTIDEMQRLKEGMEKFGRNWVKVAAHVGTRSRHQVSCRFRQEKIQ
ncbi:hypothetical protein BGZ50_007508 [Haplosporangium sp. Z 11]|nr:hypothetical protein BGZ50_007508 [Haplosporangium sp. Z 11]